MTFQNGRVIDILLVDDDLEDLRLMVEALKQTTMCYNLHFAHDGVEAMAFLRRQGKFAAAPRPDIILLDLNMPCKDGREVLAEVKQDRDLKLIPVVVLTTSADEEDIRHSFGLHANSYVTKPADLQQFKFVVKAIEDFWFGISTLPCRTEAIH
jgi:two-component system, chemotaxis family, response regulator Rcp1